MSRFMGRWNEGFNRPHTHWRPCLCDGPNGRGCNSPGSARRECRELVGNRCTLDVLMVPGGRAAGSIAAGIRWGCVHWASMSRRRRDRDNPGNSSMWLVTVVNARWPPSNPFDDRASRPWSSGCIVGDMAVRAGARRERHQTGQRKIRRGVIKTWSGR